MQITGKTGVFALFGSPVSHSASPLMYNFCFEKLNLDSVYVAIDLPKEGVKEMIQAVKLFNIKGFNLTMPCKNEAIKYLDEVSKEAEIVGAVNTVVNEDGKLKGYITDGVGFVENLISRGIEVAGKKVSILGSGGAGTAIQVELAKRGIAEMSILSRRNGFYERALSTADKIKSLYPRTAIRVLDSNIEENITEEVRKSDIFINASILGMSPNEEESAIQNLEAFHDGLTVCDIVYHPLETKLLREAKEHGLRTVNGKGMLLYQGAEAFRLFTGRKMPIHEVKTRFFMDAM